MFYSGIDQHKRDCFITTYGPEGAIVKQARVPNAPLQLQRYFAQFSGPHRAVVESTGSWYWLADLLGDLHVDLCLAHATWLKAISAAKVKTDQVDSDVLALRTPRPHAHPPAPGRESYQCEEQHRPPRPAVWINKAVGCGCEEQNEFVGCPRSAELEARGYKLPPIPG